MPTRIPWRYHRINDWRGYRIPGTAVAGASDTGSWPDSPCPTHEAKAELRRLVRECLRPAGIKARTRIGRTSNLFCCKRWLCVDAADWLRAKALADEWLAAHRHDTLYIHDAD